MGGDGLNGTLAALYGTPLPVNAKDRHIAPSTGQAEGGRFKSFLQSRWRRHSRHKRSLGTAKFCDCLSEIRKDGCAFGAGSLVLAAPASSAPNVRGNVVQSTTIAGQGNHFHPEALHIQ